MSNRIIVAVMLSTLSTWAVALESPEHKQLGDLAYHVALKIFCEKNVDDEVCVRAAQEVWFYDPLGKNLSGEAHPPLSYGDVVMCVDYFLTPEKLLARRENALIRRRSGGAASHPQHGELFPERAEDIVFNYWERCSPNIDNFEGARAGHVNHSHFQAELLAAQRTNHMLALMLRASDDNPFGAMVANAISDHYLHDSFAPGHISTMRARLTDIAANAYHDRMNRNGWSVQIDRTTLTNIFTIPGIKNRGNIIAAILQLLNDDPCVRQHFYRPITRKNESNRPICHQNIENGDVRLDNTIDFIRRVNKSIGSETNIIVKLRGDDHLWEAAQDEQRLVMLWTEVRSIFDVFESHASSASSSAEVRPIVLKDSFAKSSWSWDYDSEVVQKPGSWDFFKINVEPSTISANIGPIQYVIPQREKQQGNGDVDVASLAYRDIDRIWGVSFGIDNMTFGNSQNRKVLAVETMIEGKALHSKSSENWAILAGVQPYFGPGRDGFALTGRLAWVRPETETSISAIVRALRLGRDGSPALWRPAIGLRVDLGFTSFLTSYLQGGRDVAVQFDGSVRSGWSIGAGLQLGAPTCRLPGAKHITQCY